MRAQHILASHPNEYLLHFSYCNLGNIALNTDIDVLFTNKRATCLTTAIYKCLGNL